MGKLQGAELKIAKIILAMSGQSLAHPYKDMHAKISSIYEMGAFKSNLPVEGGNSPLFPNMHMKAEISQCHQDSFQ